MFYNNFMTLCDEKGIKPTPLLKSLGISPGNLSKWRNGTIPTGDILIKLADYFYVSTDYLLGRTDSPTSTYSVNGNNNIQAINTNNSQLTVNNTEYDETSVEIVNMVKSLPLIKRAEAILYLNELKEKK